MPGLKVRHKKTSGKPPVSDPSIVDSDDWNDDHTIVSDSRVVSASTDTLTAADDGGIVKYTTACVVTLPNNMVTDWSALLLKIGSGAITLALQSGATSYVSPTPTTVVSYADVMVTRQGGSGTSGATGSTAEYLITGDVT